MSDTAFDGYTSPALDSFRLGDAQVLSAERKLTIGDRVHKLEPKVLEVLLCLARRPGEVVSRRVLLEQVWPRSEVSDEVLSRCVYQLRRLLGDSTAHPRYIETVPKAGYRLLVAPTAIEDPPAGADMRGRPRRGAAWLWIIVAAGVATGLAAWHWIPPQRLPPPTVAVSAVSVSGDDGRLDVLAMALSDRIRSALAEPPNDQVTFEWLPAPPSRQPVVRDTGPQYFVHGELESIPGESRALLHLFIDSLSDGHAVSTPLNVFEVPYLNGSADIVDVDRYREAIVERILFYLGVELPYVHYQMSELEREAFRLLMHADWELYSGKDCGIGAQSLLQRSVELNPASARAWAQLSEAYWHQIWDCARGEELLSEAERALARAVELDPTQPYGMSMQQALLLESGAVEEAYAAVMEKASRAPDDVYVLAAKMQVLVTAGFLDQATRVLDRIDAIDPLALSAEIVDLPMALYYSGRLEEFTALAPIKPIPQLLYYRALAEWQQGNPGEARRLIGIGLDEGRSTSAYLAYLKSLDALIRGDKTAAASTLDREVLPVWQQRLDGQAAFRTAQLLSLAGEPERAAGFAGRALVSGFFCPKCFTAVPGIRELSGDPALTRAMQEGIERHLQFARRFGLPPELGQDL